MKGNALTNRPWVHPATRSRVLLSLATAFALLLAPPPSSDAAGAEGAAATVSPGLTAGHGEALTGACPTFSWTPGTAGAHELVVYALDTAGGDPAVVLALTLPAGASSWSPGRQDCLEPGGRYAWTVRPHGSEGAAGGDWAEPALFRVESGPSEDEVARAIEVLRRHLEAGGQDEVRRSAAESDADRRPREPIGSEEPVAAQAGDRSGHAPPPLRRRRGTGSAAPLAPAAAPALTSPSLTLSSDLALGDGSDVFKDGSVFLWDDSDGNTALGRLALASASGVQGNTAVGRGALSSTTGGDLQDGFGNTAVGDQAMVANTEGNWNVAVGADALVSNTSGRSNVAAGSGALYTNTTGRYNTAVGNLALGENSTGKGNVALGHAALWDNTTGENNTGLGVGALSYNDLGNRNVAVGHRAGEAVRDAGRDDNIFISNYGKYDDSGKIRIGTQGTQNATFIAGISGATTGEPGGDVVLVDSNGQLATSSCGTTYVAATSCPAGTSDGPKCDQVPAGSYCESDGECGVSLELNNCGIHDWYLRID